MICCLQSKGPRISSRKQDDFVGFRSIRSSTRQVGDDWRKAANMLAQTLHWNRIRKPDHYNSVKQKLKQILVARKREVSDGYMAYLLTEETSAITQNRSSRERVRDSFTRLIHSCQCHFIHIYVYMYVCIYNFLWIILIPSLWSELLWGTLAELSKNLMISLSLRNN